MTPALFTLLAFASFAAAFVQGASGMGFALIMAPLIGLLHPQLLPVGVLLLMLPLNAQTAMRERNAIDWRGTAWIMAGRFPGTFAGLWLLAVLTQRQLDLTVGIVTVLAVLGAALAPRFDPTRPAAIGAGLFTGLTETATSIGGPPLALLYQHAPAPILRATLAVCFLIGQIISLGFLWIMGRVDGAVMTVALGLFPPVILGATLSRHAHRRISDRGLRRFVLIFAAASGVLLVMRY